MLDPRISYEGMREDYANDPDLLQYLENTTMDLRNHYSVHYGIDWAARRAAKQCELTRVGSSAPMDTSPSRVNFTARYKKKERLDRNELEEYFKLGREEWEGCDPLQWWVARRGQFPSLYCLACDILTIPGKFNLVLGLQLSSFSIESPINRFSSHC